MSDVRLFADANALDSLRNSDFDAVSAYGEVIDNSIEAGAKKIQIRFDTQTSARGYEQIERICFGDDGCGMSPDVLHKCLQLGWSSRFNQRGGIGRFGVGMTMAAIHECQKIEVYSKEEGGEWSVTNIDLTEIKKGGDASIPDPIVKEPSKDISSLAGKESGTIVIWSKYDRQSHNATVIKSDAIPWVGRTYRHFIWEDDVEIFLNGELVCAIDPLYARTEKTRFPEDPTAQLYDPIEIDWPVDDYDAPDDAPKQSEIVIRMSVLPEDFRQVSGGGGSKTVTSRNINSNEGVSILRNRREVFYGHIPYWSISAAGGKGWSNFEEIDRWWGCEIEFDAVLDRAFTVKNIKRGAVPNTELKKIIKAKISPTRESVLQEVRRVWALNKQKKREEEAKEQGVDRPGDHDRAELVAKKTPTDKNALDSDKNIDEESEKLVQKFSDRFDDEEQAKLVALFKSQPFTIMEDSWRGPRMFEANHLGGKSVLNYNMSHVFFAAVYQELEAVEGGGDAASAARNLKDFVDLLLIAFAKAEARFEPEMELRAEDFIDNLGTSWGQYMQSYLRTWEKERGSDS